MKLVIDIPEDYYKAICKRAERFGRGSAILPPSERIIFNGTPLSEELEKITDRIDDCITNCKKQSVRNGYERGIVIGMSGCINIINDHISELKGENNEQTEND